MKKTRTIQLGTMNGFLIGAYSVRDVYKNTEDDSLVTVDNFCFCFLFLTLNIQTTTEIYEQL